MIKKLCIVFLGIILSIVVLFCVVPVLEIKPSSLPLEIKIKTMIFHNLLSVLPLKNIRESVQIPNPETTEIYDVEVKYYETFDKSEKLQINFFKTKGAELSSIEKVVVFYHAGGFVFGHPNQLIEYVKVLMENTRENVVIAVPNYRKCPEVTMNDIVQDGWTQFMNVKDYVGGFESKKVILAGESAGGRIAVFMSKKLRDTDYEVVPKHNVHVMLFYPHLCQKEEICNFVSSHLDYEHGAVVSRWFEKFLFKKIRFEGEPLSVFKDYENLPTTYCLAGEYDYVKGEGEVYIKQLEKAGVHAKFDQLDGELHMFLDPEFILDSEKFSFLGKTFWDESYEAFYASEQELKMDEEEEMDKEDMEEEIEMDKEVELNEDQDA